MTSATCPDAALRLGGILLRWLAQRLGRKMLSLAGAEMLTIRTTCLAQAGRELDLAEPLGLVCGEHMHTALSLP
jgi:hypothetical protein